MSDNVIKNIEKPQLKDALDNLKQDIFYNLNCVQIGIIQSFDSENQTAEVQFALKKVSEVKADGTKVLQERPILLQCPVFTLYGGSGLITMPVSAGDNCIILFNDRQIDEWFTLGGVQTPSTRRAHDFSDAIVLVGLKNLQNSISDYLTNGVRIAFNSANIDLTDDAIDSAASLFTHTGDFLVDGNLTINNNMVILGNVEGNGGTVNFNANLTQGAGQSISAGNGASGTFTNSVTVVNGIVTGGT